MTVDAEQAGNRDGAGNLQYEETLEAGQRFVFGAEVAEQFDSVVLQNQIPGYSQMRKRVSQAIAWFARSDTSVIDIGTSTAETLDNGIRYLHGLRTGMIPTIDFSRDRVYPAVSDVKWLGVDNSDAMIEKALKKMADLKEQLHAQDPQLSKIKIGIENHDICERDWPSGWTCPASVISSVLTVQFVPLEDRIAIFDLWYNKLQSGGALILVEKVLGPTKEIDAFLTEQYYIDKATNGMTTSAILAKRESISDFLRPLPAAMNAQLLQGAGFRATDITTIWQDLSFQATLAVKR